VRFHEEFEPRRVQELFELSGFGHPASIKRQISAAVQSLTRRPHPSLRILGLRKRAGWGQSRTMFSHVVIFWTDPAQPNATEELLTGANQYLKPIPGVLHFHVGKMATSHRPVVDQTYQVALNLVFPSKQAQDAYQVHPSHVDFVEKVFKRVCTKVVVYDFE
jgi:hypothetical protein